MQDTHRPQLCFQHDFRGHVTDSAIQIASNSGRSVSITGQAKVPHFGLESMRIDGTGCQHDIATREVLQTAPSLSIAS